MKSKKQQIQFFKQCLIPQYDIDVQRIDFKAFVDSELTTSENWRTIKDQYGLGSDHSADDLRFLNQQINHLANRVQELELKIEQCQ